MKPEIKYYDSYERFGMSGPWYGKLIVNNKELRYDFFEENDISNESNLIAFNRFEGKWIFKILILNIESNKWYISNKSFNALLLLKFLNQKIYFKETFFDLALASNCSKISKMMGRKSIDFLSILMAPVSI